VTRGPRREEVAAWIAADPDPTTRAELRALLERGDEEALAERFARPLGFGTAGLRGPVGAGPARMNRLVVRRAAAGLARFLGEGRGWAGGVVVGHDARRHSSCFAADVSQVLSAAGVPVLLLPRPLPTPLTAFAVRHLRAAAGVMVTASHNPPGDNGLKIYLADGALAAPPEEGEIARAIEAASPPPTGRRAAPVEVLDEESLVRAYADAVLKVLTPGGARALRIVYTPLHGVGGLLLPRLLAAAGFPPAETVREQEAPDPDFPTVPLPNPEEPSALALALEQAASVGADVVLANDPDADRLALALPAPDGWRALTGDELGILLAEHLLRASSGPGRVVATTVASSRMLGALAAQAGVAYEETPTGFKWIARAARRHVGARLLFGYEEALGYAACDAVADKDGISAALVAAELAASAKAAGRSLLELLDALAERLGVHAGTHWSLRREGSDGAREIAAILAELRTAPPRAFGPLRVLAAVDLAAGRGSMPPTDAIVFELERGARVVVRPSGTEPKLKAYLEVRTPPPGHAGLAGARREATTVLEELRAAVAERLGSR